MPSPLIHLLPSGHPSTAQAQHLLLGSSLIASGHSVVFADRHFGPGHRLARVAARACRRAATSNCRRACRSGFGLLVLPAVFGAGLAGDGAFGLENLRQFGATHCSDGGCVCSPVGAGTQHRHFALADDHAHDGPAARRLLLAALGMVSALLLLALFLPTIGISIQVPIAAAATVLAVWMTAASVEVCFKPNQAKRDFIFIFNLKKVHHEPS